jgi:hypothetical protein
MGKLCIRGNLKVLSRETRDPSQVSWNFKIGGPGHSSNFVSHLFNAKMGFKDDQLWGMHLRVTRSS